MAKGEPRESKGISSEKARKLYQRKEAS